MKRRRKERTRGERRRRGVVEDGWMEGRARRRGQEGMKRMKQREEEGRTRG
jgi:hypothetical protein